MEHGHWYNGSLQYNVLVRLVHSVQAMGVSIHVHVYTILASLTFRNITQSQALTLTLFKLL